MILPFCRSVSSRLAVRGAYGMVLTVVYEGRGNFVCGLILDRRTLMAKRCMYRLTDVRRMYVSHEKVARQMDQMNPRHGRKLIL